MDASDVKAAQLSKVARTSAATREATHLRLYALVHAAPVVHALPVGGLSQSELASARTLIEVLAPDAARSLALFLLFFRREDVGLVQILAATIKNSAATELQKHMDLNGIYLRPNV